MTNAVKPALAGKVALVTGASNGIGRAAARMLAAEGASVIIGYNKGVERAEALRAELPGSGHRVQQLTLEDAASIKAAVAASQAAFGKLDVLVNSAGFTRPVPHNDLVALDDDLFDAVLTANVRGPFSVIRAFRSLLEAGGESVIVNVSSIAAFTGSGSSIAYCASKAALHMLTQAMAKAWAPEVAVNCVAPGVITMGTGEFGEVAARSPMGRAATAREVASAVLYFAAAPAVVTGQVLRVDGGLGLN